jgi:hypothetical protein
MKKLLITILAFVYLTSTVGAMVRLDCCLEKLVSYSLGTTAKDNQEGEESKGNCKDDHKQAKLSHEQKRSDSHIRLAKIFLALLSTGFPEYSFHAICTLTDLYPVNHAPSLQAKVPLYILNCVHLI